MFYSLRKSRVSDEWPGTRATSTSSKNDIDPLDSQTPTRCDQDTGKIPFHRLGTINGPANGLTGRPKALFDGDDDNDDDNDDDDDDDEDEDAKYFTFCWTRAVKEVFSNASSNLNMTLSN